MESGKNGQTGSMLQPQGALQKPTPPRSASLDGGAAADYEAQEDADVAAKKQKGKRAVGAKSTINKSGNA